MSSTEAKQALQELLERYNQNKENKSFINNEKQACASLIIPLIRKILHWNTEDPSEFKVEEGQSGKRIDYCVYNQGISQFIVEAKAPSKDIFDNNDYYKQALEYGYGKEHDFAILTNFRQIVILGCQIKFRVIRETEIARLDLINASDDDLRLLLNFEKENWINSGKDNYLFTKLSKHTKTCSVDEQLLEDMKHWREQLLRNIRANSRENKFDFEDEEEFMQVEEEVQKIIDRLIFICYCEDKELREPELKRYMYDKHERFSLKPGYLLSKIRELFVDYRRVYDSDLFDKSDCDNFKIDDLIFLEIIRDLREPKERVPYDFKSIEADILGKTYENFIGHVQRGKKRFTEQEDMGKRKKEGIYYTPKYIVDYIVNNTVREYVKGKSFEEINKVKILDPACGSGSFLLRAFDVLVEESEKSLKRAVTYEEKKTLMLNCIYGVDLDKRAVDIAKLNLSLKLAWKEKLPLLRENIRQGNSLIDDEKIAGYNAFNWEEEFKDIFDNGGFNVVVGNPPYVQLSMDKNTASVLKSYLISRFKSSMGRLNTFGFFIKLGLNLLKEKGKLSFIVPNTLLTQDYYESLRLIILNNCNINNFINFDELPFKDAVVENIVFVFTKNNSKKERDANLINILSANSDFTFRNIKKLPQSSFFGNNKSSFNIRSNDKLSKLKNKIEENTQLLRELFYINQAIALKHERAKYLSNEKKDNSYKKVIDGRNIGRYSLTWKGLYLKYDPKAIHSCKREDLFLSNEKLFFRRVGNKIISTLDNEQFYALNTLVVMNKKENVPLNIKYFLGIFNSNLINFYYQLFLKSTKNVFSEIQARQIGVVPIKFGKVSEIPILVGFVDLMLSLNKCLYETKNEEEKKKLQKEIEKTDNKIDQLVYELYGITEEEQKIIEESLK